MQALKFWGGWYIVIILLWLCILVQLFLIPWLSKCDWVWWQLAEPMVGAAHHLCLHGQVEEHHQVGGQVGSVADRQLVCDPHHYSYYNIEAHVGEYHPHYNFAFCTLVTWCCPFCGVWAVCWVELASLTRENWRNLEASQAACRLTSTWTSLLLDLQALICMG